MTGDAHSSLVNHDLRPTTAEERHWTWLDYSALWIGMAHNIPTWLMAGSLIALGLTWWQSLLVIALGNVIVLVPIVLNSHPGTKYGIPFPVLARASFGTTGALMPTMIRGLVAAVWFGIQVHVGGEALHALYGQITSTTQASGGQGILGQDLISWLCFLVFLALNLLVMRRGMQALKRFEWFAAPAVLLLAIGLCAWAYFSAGGWGPIVHNPPTPTDKPMGQLMITGLMSVIGFWATLSLNASDFTRFARSQKDQAIGQAVGLPGTMVAFSFLGVMTTSATAVLFGTVIWDPVKLAPLLPSPALTIVCLIGIILATLSVNIPANLVSASYDISNMAPHRIDLWRGSLIVAAIGTLIMPWRLLATADTYLFDWLGNSAIVLAPVAGILIADYWVVRKRELRVEDLYRHDGIYGRVNWRAILAALVGIAVAFSGKWLPAAAFLFEIGWVTAFATAFVVYLAVSDRKAAT
jgi:NCS1 family nucleobase:cation symporter-1